jgi:hypothetical protein
MFDRGVVHIVVAGYNVDQYCLRFDKGVVHIIVAGYNVDHYCFMFDRGVVHIAMAGDIVDYYCLNLTEEWFILLRLFILLTINV